MPTMHGNVLSWATDLDTRTLEQAERSASLPIIPGPVALMPDAHFGYGATVGSVIPTEGAVIPSAVGVDPRPVDGSGGADRPASPFSSTRR